MHARKTVLSSCISCLCSALEESCLEPAKETQAGAADPLFIYCDDAAVHPLASSLRIAVGEQPSDSVLRGRYCGEHDRDCTCDWPRGQWTREGKVNPREEIVSLLRGQVACPVISCLGQLGWIDRMLPELTLLHELSGHGLLTWAEWQQIAREIPSNN